MVPLVILLALALIIVVVDGLNTIPKARSSVVIKPLPTLYVYDHCPYCVRYLIIIITIIITSSSLSLPSSSLHHQSKTSIWSQEH